MTAHMRMVTRALVTAEQLDERWVAAILSTSHNILTKLRPDVIAGAAMAVYRFKENMDICHYARIKVRKEPIVSDNAAGDARRLD